MISRPLDLLCTSSHHTTDNDSTQSQEIQPTSLPAVQDSTELPFLFFPSQMLLFIFYCVLLSHQWTSLDQTAVWFKVGLPAANSCQSNCEVQTIYSYYFLWAPLHSSSSRFLTIQMRVGVKSAFCATHVTYKSSACHVFVILFSDCES